jgi:hypothetical protein
MEKINNGHGKTYRTKPLGKAGHGVTSVIPAIWEVEVGGS